MEAEINAARKDFQNSFEKQATLRQNQANETPEESKLPTQETNSNLCKIMKELEEIKVSLKETVTDLFVGGS